VYATGSRGPKRKIREFSTFKRLMGVGAGAWVRRIFFLGQAKDNYYVSVDSTVGNNKN